MCDVVAGEHGTLPRVEAGIEHRFERRVHVGSTVRLADHDRLRQRPENAIGPQDALGVERALGERLDEPTRLRFDLAIEQQDVGADRAQDLEPPTITEAPHPEGQRVGHELVEPFGDGSKIQANFDGAVRSKGQVRGAGSVPARQPSPKAGGGSLLPARERERSPKPH